MAYEDFYETGRYSLLIELREIYTRDNKLQKLKIHLKYLVSYVQIR